jgi:uncharacterized protein (DUF924 family)
MVTIEEVLGFWFEESAREDWYARNDAFDGAIRERFAEACDAAAAGAFAAWTETARGCVALCILLDQVPRNIHRGDARAYASDARALTVARDAVERGLDKDPGLGDAMRRFLYLPFEHSEDIHDQRLCVALAEERIEDATFRDYARRHLEIIERFGRFPHRNAVLGRDSTADEIEFLSGEGSSF